MWPYNQGVHPPAPFLDVSVSHPITGQSLAVSAKLDTAADITTIPETVRDALGLAEARTLPIEGYDGITTTLRTYVISLELPQARARQLEVIAIPESHILLGRDVLNQFYVKLNGPELTFDMSLSPL